LYSTSSLTGDLKTIDPSCELTACVTRTPSLRMLPSVIGSGRVLGVHSITSSARASSVGGIVRPPQCPIAMG